MRTPRHTAASAHGYRAAARLRRQGSSKKHQPNARTVRGFARRAPAGAAGRAALGLGGRGSRSRPTAPHRNAFHELVILTPMSDVVKNASRLKR